MTNYSINPENPIFGPFFANFPHVWWNVFSNNLILSPTNSYGFLTPCQNSEKTNHPIPQRHLERQRGGQTLFQSAALATAEGPKTITKIITTNNVHDKKMTKYNLKVNIWKK